MKPDCLTGRRLAAISTPCVANYAGPAPLQLKGTGPAHLRQNIATNRNGRIITSRAVRRIAVLGRFVEAVPLQTEQNELQV